MRYKEKITELRDRITQELSPLLEGKDCVLLEAPYYNNIGDLCIWQGELEFLNSIDANILLTKSLYWTPTDKIDRGIVILLQGGGNFGDIYRISQDFRLKVIDKYRENRIVMFPQSVWYDDSSLIEQDAAIMAKHPDLWLCARDSTAYAFLKKHFSANHILLVPDMAFYISDSTLDEFRGQSRENQTLFMRRTDQELTDTTPKYLQNTDIKDWPGIQGGDFKYWMFNQCRRGIKVLSYVSVPLARQWEKFVDFLADKYLRSRLTSKGLGLIGSYDRVITTRLHAMILGILLGKKVDYIDNKTGKLTDYVSTWLTDLDSVNPI